MQAQATVELVGTQRVRERLLGHTQCQHLVGKECLARCAVFSGLDGRLQHIVWKVATNALNQQCPSVWSLDGADFHANSVGLPINGRICRSPCRRLVGVKQWPVGLDVPEDGGLKAVVVPLQDGIKLVVVATGTLHRHAHHAPSDGREHVVEIVVSPFRIVFLAKLHPRACPQEAGGNQRLVCHVVQFVTRNLLADELTIRLVLIEGVDDVIAVAPRVWTIVVLLESRRVGIAGDVHPVTAPAFAVVRRSEQLVDDALPGPARRVGEKRVNLRRRRWQADQIKIGPSQPCQWVGARGRVDTRVLAGGLKKSIDRMLISGSGWHGRLFGQLERPIVACAKRQLGILKRRNHIFRAGRTATVPMGPVIDPCSHGRDLRLAHRAPAHRHFRVIETSQHAIQSALFSSPWYQRRTACATT